MKTKLIPPFLMLFAGAVTSIEMFIMGYELKTLLSVLLAVLVVFYIVGLCIKKVMDTFRAANEAKAAEEGEVIEKDADEPEQQEEKEEGTPEEKTGA